MGGSYLAVQELKASPTNYDVWFDYLRLEEANGVPTTIRDVYERAIAVIPPAKEKRLWRRYIFLWVNYALYEEIDAEVRRRRARAPDRAPDRVAHRGCVATLEDAAPVRQDIERARKVYLTVLNLVPHKVFTFAKLWLLYAHFEVRQHNVDAARKALGRAIGTSNAAGSWQRVRRWGCIVDTSRRVRCRPPPPNLLT